MLSPIKRSINPARAAAPRRAGLKVLVMIFRTDGLPVRAQRLQLWCGDVATLLDTSPR
jgi:hypothetical protein